jgi:hypothetical protein
LSCLGQLVRAAWSAIAAMTADPIMSAATFNAFPMAREEVHMDVSDGDC